MKKLFLFVLCVMSSQLLTAKIVGPLIQTQWSQEEPFNLLCPEINGKHSPASCGAAAMAQICYYYRWPEESWNSGYLRLEDGSEIIIDHLPVPVEYDKMLLTYDENSSEEAKMAVALLVRNIASYCGSFGEDLTYSPSPTTLSWYFNYDKGLMHLIAGYFSREEMKNIIRTELDAGRPVILSGSNGSMGHDFICDGYNDETDEYHLNYGWAGDYDGWSTLENCLFPVNMEITFNIKKDEDGQYGFTLSSNKDFKWVGGNMLYGNFKFETYYNMFMQLQVALAVENAATHEVQYFFHTDRPKDDISDMGLTWEMDVDLPDGSYILYPVGRDASCDGEWKKSYFRDLCQREVALTVKDGVKTFANNNINDYVREGAVEVDGLCYELTEWEGSAILTYRNDKYSSYSGNIVVPETITVDAKTYPVTSIGREAFRDCVFLDQVVIGKNVTMIDWGAFDHINAKKITFAEGSQLNRIEGDAFYASTIQEIILPEGLEKIGYLAFANSNLTSVTIPSTVTEWVGSCFFTTNLISLHVNSMTPPVLETQCFRENTDNEDFSGQSSAGSSYTVLYVPSGTKEVYAQADPWKNFGFILEPGDDDSFVEQIIEHWIEFDGIKYEFNGVKGIARSYEITKDMEDVIFKNTISMGEKELAVTRLRYQIINGTNHRRVVIPANVEVLTPLTITNSEIGSLEFEEGSHLKRIEDSGLSELSLKSPLVLPEGLEFLGHLYLKDVADMTIPASVKEMRGQLEIQNLKHLRVSWQEPLVVDNLFVDEEAAKKITLHVPAGTKELYANAEGWKLVGKIVEGNGDVNGDGKVDATDIVDIVNHLMGKSTSTGKFIEKEADINGDGTVNVADILSLTTLINL